MPRVAAVQIEDDRVTLAVGSASGGRFTLETVIDSPLAIQSVSANGGAASPAGGAGSSTSGTGGEQVAPPPLTMRLDDDQAIDSVVAVVRSSSVLYDRMALPFADPKKIEKVAPVQLQDVLPFELNECIVDSRPAGKSPQGGFDVLCALAPVATVERALEVCSSVGADPELITTSCCAVLGLLKLFRDKCQGTFALFDCHRTHCSLAVVVQDEVKHLREFGAWNSASDIKSSLAQVERDYQVKVSTGYAVGDAEVIRELTREIQITLEPLDLSTRISTSPKFQADTSKVGWVVGMLAYVVDRRMRKALPVLDLRRDQFSYKPALRAVISAFQEWVWFLAAGPLALVIYIIVSVSGAEHEASKIENRIQEILAKDFAGEPIGYGEEVDIARTKTSQVEEQLRRLGSLSALSPLEALRELSEAVDPSVDITLDELNIKGGVLSFTGSGSSAPQVASLERLLKSRSKVFCEPKVEPDAAEQGRVPFEAEIHLCD